MFVLRVNKQFQTVPCFTTDEMVRVVILRREKYCDQKFVAVSFVSLLCKELIILLLEYHTSHRISRRSSSTLLMIHLIYIALLYTNTYSNN